MDEGEERDRGRLMLQMEREGTRSVGWVESEK
jgi:hypothetical protein